jgi:formylglycine-generating enzyme required for sulfatase activity
MTDLLSEKTICSKCGFAVPAQARFCGRCGNEDLDGFDERGGSTLTNYVRCASCNSFYEADGDFCEHCGAKVIAVATADPTPPIRDQPIEEPANSGRRSQWLILAGVVLGSLIVIPAISLLLNKLYAASSNNQNNQQNQTKTHPGMVLIDGGNFMMGDDKGDEYEKPAHPVFVQPFYLDQNEVTCGDYTRFLNATSRHPPAGWGNKVCPVNAPGLPVTGVDWNEANAYARWRNARLPTEEEWEFAARANDGRKYPWGNSWVDGLANAGKSSASHLVNVGSYPKGKNPYGLFDMTGNAWEWTSSQLVAYPGWTIPISATSDLKVIRGGSFQDESSQVTTTYRGYQRSTGEKDYSATGFRCAVDAWSNH